MDPIIRTCSLFALALSLIATPALAKREAAGSALGRYVQARVAGSEGRLGEAVAAYSAALTADPASAPVALRAYRQALEAGNKPLALRAIRTLAAANQLPVDARLLLLSESFNRSDWRGAQVQIDKMEEAGTLAFLTPVLRAWMMQGAKMGDALGALSARSSDGLSATYTQEHRGLLLLASGQVEEGVAAINAQRAMGLTNAANLQLRLSAAQRLIELRQKDAAMAMLAGDQSALVIAREDLAAGRPVSTSITRPVTGMSMLLARVANDLVRENASPVALTLGRLATFADPDFAPARLVLAKALSSADAPDSGLAEIAAPSKSRVMAELTEQLRLDLLLSAKKYEAALAIVSARAQQSSATAFDQSRLAGVLSRMGRSKEAAAVYAKTIEMLAGPDRKRPVPANLWLLLGREYDAAKDWARAKPALQRAVQLAPDDASGLNHLGYAMLLNGESIAEATTLIAKANKLRPEDSAIADSLGWALFKGGKLTEAIAILETATQSEPTIAEIGEHLGDAYWAAGRRIDARYAWSAALVQAEEADTKRLAAKIDFGPAARP